MIHPKDRPFALLLSHLTHLAMLALYLTVGHSVGGGMILGIVIVRRGR